jgi:hypothetical protein
MVSARPIKKDGATARRCAFKLAVRTGDHVSSRMQKARGTRKPLTKRKGIENFEQWQNVGVLTSGHLFLLGFEAASLQLARAWRGGCARGAALFSALV